MDLLYDTHNQSIVIRFISEWRARKCWLEYTTTQGMNSWSKYTTDELKSEKLIK